MYIYNLIFIYIYIYIHEYCIDYYTPWGFLDGHIDAPVSVPGVQSRQRCLDVRLLLQSLIF